MVPEERRPELLCRAGLPGEVEPEECPDCGKRQYGSHGKPPAAPMRSETSLRYGIVGFGVRGFAS